LPRPARGERPPAAPADGPDDPAEPAAGRTERPVDRGHPVSAPGMARPSAALDAALNLVGVGACVPPPVVPCAVAGCGKGARPDRRHCTGHWIRLSARLRGILREAWTEMQDRGL